MKRALLFLVHLITLVTAPIVQAEWFEVEGSATVVASDSTARYHALNDAIYQAMAFAGADIGTISLLTEFIEVDREQYQFTNHEIRFIEVIDERTRNGKKTLRVRLDIYPSANGCQVGQYKKTFLVGNFDIESPQQAVMGQIYSLGDDFSRVLDRQIDQQSLSFLSVGTTNYPLNKDNPSMVTMVAQDYAAQYLISGKITDLTATIESSLLSSDVINRQFAADVSILDGKTGHEVFRKNYREIARWPFAKTSLVDTSSGRFWSSTYGEMLLRVSRDIMLDLESELSCKITLPQVVKVYGDTVTIDLGRIHGVQVDDELSLWHTGAFIDQAGNPRNKVTASNITLKVSRVYDQEAELKVMQPELATSIQLGDVMHKAVH
ncbi:flagellar basal-body protein [Vibrio sp. qd031]|uniref:flagellar assembly protein FlgT n=1 Tax=Vibrio sp. qd031 TaxID=1603038 RepID=UPI000A111945|nr:flagellar assembly protein FlgT [Vibrio sp. qd031]ORT50297.1 flagellar basal-body protein [Vibrio sp. qd031]